MKIKVISDGTISGTKVFDADTGELMPGVQAVTWHLDIDSIKADVVIKLVQVPVEIVGTVDDKNEDKKRLDEISKNLEDKKRLDELSKNL